MTVKSWIVECDICSREIDAIEEGFIQADDLDICNECFSEAESGDRTYTIKWEATIKGIQKIRAKSLEDARKKVQESMNIKTVDNHPEWVISEVWIME